MIKRIFFIIFITAIFFFSAERELKAFSSKPQGPKKYIRVAIIKGKKDINLSLKGDYQILTLHTNEPLVSGRNLKSKVYPTFSGLKVGKDDFKVFGIRIETSRDASIVIDGRCFRGMVDIIREEDVTLLVVNHIDIEEYLCGVLYHEVSHLWHMEALKVQAVASRTFALYQNKVNKNQDYDLTNTSYSQVYGGATSEKYRTNKAVIKTYGEILTYKGEIFPTYFHATCGGYTEDASCLWNVDIPPLKGVKCGYCEKSPHYNWQREVSLKDIAKKLNDNKIKVGKIYAIEPISYDKSGRITNLKITHSEGTTLISAYRFRIFVGPTLIKSASFTVEVRSGCAYFTGKGWGHGVGMCQWGACFLAKEGYSKEYILQFYYPQTKIMNIWSDDDRS